ncbi:MAG: outer membrane protein transport protein [Endozoicomonas sp. (ex Botrylloides leachii)]|nr:outer membrane protein transport protein [Endozoicomonas sp. (ex Botrylloides leachii)]
MQISINNKILLASAVGLTLQAGLVQAGGIAVNENSASSMGTAYAGRASDPEDASIGAVNPAGIAFLDKRQVTLGSTVISKGGNFENGSYTHSNIPPSSPNSKDFLKTTVVPFGHFATPVSDKFSFGLDAYAPFGMNLNYDDKFAGRYFGEKTSIKNFNLQSTFAYKIQDNLSIGLGVGVSYLSGTLTQKLYQNMPVIPDANNINASIKGDAYAMIWNVGALWRPTNKTAFGLAYHAATKFNLSGDISANNINVGPVNIGFRHKAELDITMPETVMLSATHHINDKWTVMADATWTGWDKLDHLYISDEEANAVENGSNYLALNWRNTWQGALGAAYTINSQWMLKAGYMFDQSPVTNENRTVRAPDANRNWFTVGAKWNASKDLTFDMAAAYVLVQDGTVNEGAYNPDGTPNPDYGRITGDYVNESVWLFSAQATYRF